MVYIYASEWSSIRLQKMKRECICSGKMNFIIIKFGYNEEEDSLVKTFNKYKIQSSGIALLIRVS